MHFIIKHGLPETLDCPTKTLQSIVSVLRLFKRAESVGEGHNFWEESGSGVIFLAEGRLESGLVGCGSRDFLVEMS